MVEMISARFAPQTVKVKPPSLPQEWRQKMQSDVTRLQPER